MKPKLITTTQTFAVAYWDCGQSGHRHKTEGVAQACVSRQQEKVANRAAGRTSGPNAIRWTSTLCAFVLQEYRDGARKCDLARKYCVSYERIRQVLYRAERIEKYPLLGLKAKIRKGMYCSGLRTIEEIRTALANGKLGHVQDIGPEGENDIRRLLAELPPIKPHQAPAA